jgi:hypothetical protein
MGIAVIEGLIQDSDLEAQFEKDPLGAIQELERRTGQDLSKVNRGHIAIIQHMTTDERRALVTIAHKARAFGSEYFKIGGVRRH